MEGFRIDLKTFLGLAMHKQSRHMEVCHAAQGNGAHANGVSLLTGTTKLQFSCIHSSMMSCPNGAKLIVKLAYAGEVTF